MTRWVQDQHNGPHVEYSTQKKFDVVIIPGGAKGAATISECSGVQTLIKDHLDQGKIVGMICAGNQTAGVI